MRAKLSLFFICLLSVGLIVITDNFSFNFLSNYSPVLSIIAQIRLSSLLVCFLLYRYSKQITNSNLLVAPNRKKTIMTALVWIIPTAYFVFVKRVWVPEISTWIDVTAFMVTGLLAEELLFRGSIFGLANKVMPNIRLAGLSAAVLISAIFFGLQHFSYHHFQFTQAAITQVTYTFVMGIFFGIIRESSGKLWPVILLHFITNSFTLFRNF